MRLAFLGPMSRAAITVTIAQLALAQPFLCAVTQTLDEGLATGRALHKVSWKDTGRELCVGFMLIIMS